MKERLCLWHAYRHYGNQLARGAHSKRAALPDDDPFANPERYALARFTHPGT